MIRVGGDVDGHQCAHCAKPLSEIAHYSPSRFGSDKDVWLCYREAPGGTACMRAYAAMLIRKQAARLLAIADEEEARCDGSHTSPDELERIAAGLLLGAEVLRKD